MGFTMFTQIQNIHIPVHLRACSRLEIQEETEVVIRKEEN